MASELRIARNTEMVIRDVDYIIAVWSNVSMQSEAFVTRLERLGIAVVDNLENWVTYPSRSDLGDGIKVSFRAVFADEDTVAGWRGKIEQAAYTSGARWARADLALDTRAGTVERAAEEIGERAEDAANAIGRWSLATTLVGIGLLAVGAWLWFKR